jgi:hypothetical protein
MKQVPAALCHIQSKARINRQSARDRNQKPKSNARVRAIGIKSPNHQPESAQSESKARIISQRARNRNQKPESNARVRATTIKARIECLSARPESQSRMPECATRNKSRSVQLNRIYSQYQNNELNLKCYMLPYLASHIHHSSPLRCTTN